MWHNIYNFFRARRVSTKLDQPEISTVLKMLDEISQQSNEFTLMAVGIHHQNQLVNLCWPHLTWSWPNGQSLSRFFISVPISTKQIKNYKTKILFDFFEKVQTQKYLEWIIRSTWRQMLEGTLILIPCVKILPNWPKAIKVHFWYFCDVFSTIRLELRPRIEVFTHNNGAQQSLINLLGTIPVFYKGKLECPLMTSKISSRSPI